MYSLLKNLERSMERTRNTRGFSAQSIPTPSTNGCDEVVVIVAMMVGAGRVQKALVAQTMFDLPLEAARTPVLVIGHAGKIAHGITHHCVA
jgi:hypothetical protein